MPFNKQRWNSRTTMPKYREERIIEKIHTESRDVLVSRFRNLPYRLHGGFSFVIGVCTALVFFGCTYVGYTVSRQNKLVSVSKEPQQHAGKFVPPSGMRQLSEIRSPDGQLSAIVYGKNEEQSSASLIVVKTNDPSGSELWSVTLQDPGVWQDPVWMKNADTDYLVIGTPLPITESQPYGGLHLTFTTFAKDAQGYWGDANSTSKDVPSAVHYYVTNDKLLVQEEAIGLGAPIVFSFGTNGVSDSVITNKFPTSNLANSKMITLQVQTVNSPKGVTVRFAVDTSPIRIHVGETLVVRVVSSQAVGIEILAYPSHGDPGDGNLATRLPSPYTSTFMFRMDHLDSSGYLKIVPMSLSANQTVSIDGTDSIPIEVLP